jgi:hypothetical protein
VTGPESSWGMFRIEGIFDMALAASNERLAALPVVQVHRGDIK